MIFREIGNYSMRSIFIEKYQNGLLRVGEVGWRAVGVWGRLERRCFQGRSIGGPGRGGYRPAITGIGLALGE